jgi:hypothetical protein
VKFEVKVGRPIEGSVVVVVSREESEKKKSFSFSKAVAAVLASLLLGVVAASIAYGEATGDYSIVKSIAESGKEVLIELAAKIATKSTG